MQITPLISSNFSYLEYCNIRTTYPVRFKMIPVQVIPVFTEALNISPFVSWVESVGVAQNDTHTKIFPAGGEHRGWKT